MSVFASLKEKVPYIIMSVAVLVGLVAPGIISTHAFAAQVTERSIALGSSSADADNVTYGVSFTSVAAAGAFVIDFCSNTPDPAVACIAPNGFSAASVTTATQDYTVAVDGSNVNRVIVTHTIGANEPVEVNLDGINNPSESGPLYARISTYTDATSAGAATAGDLKDQGSVAISINDTIGVSGAVLESMTFCVASDEITKDCANASANKPVLELGEKSGDLVALSASDVSTGLLYTQISTNAASGVVINLKSSTECGGLKRVGATDCDIAPALTDGITEGQAKFGLKTGTAAGTTGDTEANGTIKPVGSYNPTTFVFNYLANNTSGVTSAIGDPFLNTDGKPANNQNMPITFGASVANNTPAGNYATDLSMIATGKF